MEEFILLAFNIEYEIPPLRAIYQSIVESSSIEGAISNFKSEKPDARIRKVSGPFSLSNAEELMGN
jgi:hypothetical protein